MGSGNPAVWLLAGLDDRKDKPLSQRKDGTPSAEPPALFLFFHHLWVHEHCDVVHGGPAVARRVERPGNCAAWCVRRFFCFLCRRRGGGFSAPRWSGFT